MDEWDFLESTETSPANFNASCLASLGPDAAGLDRVGVRPCDGAQPDAQISHAFRQTAPRSEVSPSDAIGPGHLQPASLEVAREELQKAIALVERMTQRHDRERLARAARQSIDKKQGLVCLKRVAMRR